MAMALTSVSVSFSTPNVNWWGRQLVKWLSPADGGLHFLATCRPLQAFRPHCLRSSSASLWVNQALAEVALEGLCQADEEICSCLQWVRDSPCGSFRVSYCNDYDITLRPSALDEAVHPSKRGLLTALDVPEPAARTSGNGDDEDGGGIEVARTVAALAQKCDIFVAMELGERVVALPEHVYVAALRAQEGGAVAAAATAVSVEGQEDLGHTIIRDLGLSKWSLVETSPLDTNSWGRMRFVQAAAPRPLLVWHFDASFDLAGGDGSGSCTLGALMSDCTFLFTSRYACEYFVRRRFATAVHSSWLAALACFSAHESGKTLADRPQLPRSGPPEAVRPPDVFTDDGWTLHTSGMLELPYIRQTIVDAPNLAAAYADFADLKNRFQQR